MEIRVDRSRCAGSGLCMLRLPAVFDQSDDDGKVLLLTPRPGAELAKGVRGAAAKCPAGAITLDEPRNHGEMYAAVAALWRKVLRVPEVSDEDDFFELGGHSLAAIQMVTDIERLYQARLDGMRDLWENPTLGQFTALIARRLDGPDLALPASAPPAESGDPSRVAVQADAQ